MLCLTENLFPLGSALAIWLLATLIILEVRKIKFESGNATDTPIGNLMRTQGNEATVWAARGLSVFPVAWRCLRVRARSRGVRRKGSMGSYLCLVLTGKGNIFFCFSGFLLSVACSHLTGGFSANLENS